MKPYLDPEILTAFASLSTPEEVEALFRDLLTPNEVEAVSERWAIVRRLMRGRTQRDVARELGVSVTTVSRGASALKYGSGGFRLAVAAVQRYRYATRTPEGIEAEDREEALHAMSSLELYSDSVDLPPGGDVE